MGAQTPFDRKWSWFEIRKVHRDGIDFAGVHFVTPDQPMDPKNPIAIGCIGGDPEKLPADMADPDLLREQLQWLVGGCAAFHGVEVRNYIDDEDNPVITPARK